MKNLNLDKKVIVKFLLLSLFFLFIFYLFIFKNILLYNEISENITNENIRFEKISLEKKIISEAFEDKRKEVKILKENLNKILLENKKKDNFNSISEVLMYINKNILDSKLILISFARSTKNNKNIDISLNIKGKETNIKKFLRLLENGEKNINLSKNYFKFSAEKNLVSAKLSSSCLIQENKFDKSLTKELKNFNSFKELEKEKNVFLVRNKNSGNSLMRIGEKKYFKAFRKEETKTETVTNKSK